VATGGKGIGRTALALSGLVAGMLALSAASVPLYRLFCQVTGFGGTPRIAAAVPETALPETIIVRFDANVSRELPWRFEPVQREMTVRLGEQGLAFYRATNIAARPTTGTASFNVSPDVAGVYFNKVACFCFSEQTLGPGESMEMPVSFFVDPALLADPNSRSTGAITLSYTFFAVPAPRQAQASARPTGG
jgi:cytochrome c oxidase assembly protein subunit 11